MENSYNLHVGVRSSNYASNVSRISCVVCERQAERSEARNEHPRRLHPIVRPHVRMYGLTAFYGALRH